MSAPSKVNIIIDAIIAREGGFVNDKVDRGGRTIYGISERAHPVAWKNGPPTLDDARRIYAEKYIQPFTGLESHPALESLVDWGVTSGPGLVVQCLQRVVGAEVDGVLGPQTLAAVQRFEPGSLTNLMAAERVRMIGRIVKRDPTQLKYINGWLDRALTWLS